MAIATILSSFFGGGKKEEAAPRFPTQVEQICISMELLAAKATTLNEQQWEKERQALAALQREVQALRPLDEISSAKFEQDILGKITSVSSACDSVISGKRSVDLAAEVQGLQTLVKQRKAMQ